MRYQQLQCVLEVAKHKSISAAAKAMYMSQSTLSTTMKNLEEELGLCLFERGSDGVVITEDGRQALEYAREICRSYDKLQVLKQSVGESDNIKIYVSPGTEAFLPGLLDDLLLDRAPELHVSYHKIRNSEERLEVMMGESYISVTHMSDRRVEQTQKLSEKYDIVMKKLGTDRLYLIVREDHPLAQQESVDIKQIQHMEIAGLQQYRDSIASIAYEPRMGYTNRYTTLPSIKLLKKAVLEQNMAAISTGTSLLNDNTMKSGGLRMILLTDPERSGEVPIWITYRRQWGNTRNGRLLLRCIEESILSLNLPEVHKYT